MSRFVEKCRGLSQSVEVLPEPHCIFALKREESMERLIVASEDDLKRILREIVSELFQSGKKSEPKADIPEEELLTSLRQIAKLFRCSLPTAQKIKNSIPTSMYAQVGKKFAIRKSVLLTARPKR